MGFVIALVIGCVALVAGYIYILWLAYRKDIKRKVQEKKEKRAEAERAAKREEYKQWMRQQCCRGNHEWILEKETTGQIIHRDMRTKRVVDTVRVLCTIDRCTRPECGARRGVIDYGDRIEETSVEHLESTVFKKSEDTEE